MKNVLVSVVCTNYNKGDWIAEAIESFLSQEVDFAYEIIVIDDHSTDHSPNIIKEYEKKYPELIRGLYNNKNLGITRTWLKACKQAKGTYIARCDGDDFWTDTKKLQKQVAALRDNPNSLWCTTDFDMILPDGTSTYKAAFESGVMVRANSYENMLATKGFTMASTWLVEVGLMLAINESIDANAIDDTFNLQIELFHRTELTYLPQAMAAYRVGHESDSHPGDVAKAKARIDKLLGAQLEYLDRYRKDVDLNELTTQSLVANRNLEAILIDRNVEIDRLNNSIKRAEDALSVAMAEREAIKNSKKYKIASILVYPVHLMRKLRSKFL